MRFASIGSGSEGNGLIIEAGATRVLIDCGFGVKDTTARLQRLGVEPESLTAILVTHEHSDHVGGVPAFGARYEIPVWLTFGTLENDGAAAIIRAIDTSRLQHLIAAHLSKQNNTPAMARAALSGALGCASEWIGVATQETGFDWRGLA